MSIRQDFIDFHAANPDVLVQLEQEASRWFAAGNYAIGIGALFERLRWQRGMTTKGDPFKLNNNYRAEYSRLILQRHPAWDGRIKTRALKAAR